LFAVGAAFRLWHLDDPIRYDEAFTYLNYAGRPIWEALKDYGTLNNHFLNTLLVRLAASVLGDQPAAWRLPNLLAGLGTIILAGVIAKRWFGKGAGVIALAVTCISPVMAHFSVLARGYGLSLFFGLTALYFVDMRHERPAGALPIVGACVSCALACYAVPTAVLFVFAVFAYDAYRTYQRRARFTTLLPLWVPAALLTFILYLPPLITSGPEAFFATVGGPSEAPFSLSGLRLYGAALLDEKTWGLGGGWFWLPVAAVGLVVGGVKRPAFAVLAGVSVLGGIILIAAGFRPPERVFIYLLPVLSFGTGAAAEVLWQRLRSRGSVRKAVGVALVVAAVAGVAVAERGRYLSDSIRAGAAPAALPVVKYLAENNTAGIRLIATAPLNYPLMYYTRKLGCDEVRILTARSPRAFTYEAFVAVPAGTPPREVVREGTGGSGVVLRADLVTPISDAGIWKALIACPDVGSPTTSPNLTVIPN
jgi:hypothetical protein